jgi:hypothetical protein
VHAQALAAYVAQRLGGPAHEEQLAAAYGPLAASLKAGRGRSVILLLGGLPLGTSRHRALLFKALADDMGMASAILRGAGTGTAAARAAAAHAGAGAGAPFGGALLAGGAGGSSAGAGSSGAGAAAAAPGCVGGLRSALVVVSVGGQLHHLDLLTAPGTLTPLAEGQPVLRPSEWCGCLRGSVRVCIYVWRVCVSSRGDTGWWRWSMPGSH